jgi:hypothetical protein
MKGLDKRGQVFEIKALFSVGDLFHRIDHQPVDDTDDHDNKEKLDKGERLLLHHLPARTYTR